MFTTHTVPYLMGTEVDVARMEDDIIVRIADTLMHGCKRE